VVTENFLDFEQVANSRRFRRHRLQSDVWHSCDVNSAE
jgi:hypothetical protein